MQLSSDILDHIFSFLASHRETLISCSEDPVLSPIIERHLYYHLIVHIGNGESDFNYTFEPNRLSSLISENPRILHYVKILQVESDSSSPEWAVNAHLQEFSKTLLMFPTLECIMLTNRDWPTAFQAALADRLRLPTVKEVHFVVGNDFPPSLLNNCQNITNLALSGSLRPHDPVPKLLLSQLKSLKLDLCTEFISYSLLDWLRLNVNGLQSMSLKCGSQSAAIFPELLDACSGTLTKLEIDFERGAYHNDEVPGLFLMDTGTFVDPSVPGNLQQLTIRTAVAQSCDNDNMPPYSSCSSSLMAAGQIMSLFIYSGPPQHLIIDLDVTDLTDEFAEIDFSPLVVLGASSLSIPRIDLYVRTDVFPALLVHTRLMCLLVQYEGILRMIKEGVLVIHYGKTAPDWVCSTNS